MDAWQIAWFTVACAALATIVMVPPGVLIAWMLARRQVRGRAVIEALVSLPLVVPPVATGLILLMLFGRRGSLGGVLERLGIEVVFTWKAVVLAMAIMGLPLLVRTARAGFEQVNERYERVAATLGAPPLRVFLTISLPLAWPSVLGGAMLGFARALGEFGATIVVAGSIPGQTRTLAVAIYSYAETGQDAQALTLVLVSVGIAFVALAAANWLVARRAA
jgi:molybdate transport system permease protein